MSHAAPLNGCLSGRLALPLLLALIAAGALGNYFRFPIFLNIDFVFGSIFAMLALQFFGLGRGIAAAALIAGTTYLLWNHPYAIVIMTAEVAFAGWLAARYRLELVLADTLYWLCIGMPLVYFFYHGVMDVAPGTTTIVMIKQAINGIANALLARLVFTGFSLHSRTALLSFRGIFCNLLAFFVLFPALLMLALGSRADFDQTDRAIRTSLVQDRQQVTQRAEAWVAGRKSAIVTLAAMAAEQSPLQMQAYLAMAKKSDGNYLRVGLLNKEGVTTAGFPLVDELERSHIGNSFADRPFIAQLKQNLAPLLADVVMGGAGTPRPMVLMIAPVVAGGQYAGSVFAVLSLTQIQEYLEKSVSIGSTLYTLLDKNGNVMMSNRTDQTAMKPFLRAAGTLTALDAGIGRWLPVLPDNTPVAEQWKDSYYVAEATVGDLAEWKLILEQPVAPFQKALYDSYTGKLTLLFVILLVALALAEFLGRRSVSTLKILNALTRELPSRLAKEGNAVAWPETAIAEEKHLIENFTLMADSLSAQFNEVRQVNKSLEQRVEARTALLKESEKRFSSMFRNHSALMLLVDPGTGEIIDANVAAEKFYGYPRKTLLGMNIGEIHAIDLDHIANDCQAVLAEQRNYFVFRHRREGGEIRTVEVHSTAITINETTLLFSIIHDITKRRQAEERLRKLSIAVEQGPASVVITDLAGSIEYVNPRFTEVTGYEASEAIGRNPRILQSGLVDKAVYVGLWDKLTSGREWHGELINKRKNGEFYWEDALIAPVKNASGAVTHYVAVKTDISGRKQLEEAREEALSRLQKIASRLPGVVYQYRLRRDGSSCFPFASDAMREIYGFSPEELREDASKVFGRLHPDDLVRIQESILKSAEGLTPWQEEYRVRFDDGAVRWVFGSSIPQREADGSVLWHGFIHDITERKETVEELKRSNADLEQFAYAASHDLRQPLRMISSYLQLLEMELNAVLNEDTRQNFLFATEGAQRMDQMLAALLDYARVGRNAGAMIVAESRAPLEEALRYLHPEIIEAQAAIRIEGVWPVVLGRRDDMARLFQNLIGNALKYRIEGRPPEVVVLAEPANSAGNSGGEHRFSVRDNGVGLIRGQEKRLFKVFERLQPRDKYPGTGIGLAVCRKIVEHHGGCIRVESAGEGRGCTFVFTLPVAGAGCVTQGSPEKRHE